MKITDKVRLSMKKQIYSIKGEKVEVDKIETFQKYRPIFDTALAQYDPSVFDEFENIYRGTKTTKANINSKSTKDVKKTNNVPNIVFELIESQVNTATPDAVVKSKKPGFDDYARMIQEKINSDFDEFDAETVSDIGERNTAMHGLSPVLLTWNTDLGLHEYIGEKELIDYHPKQVIPQPNVFKVNDMDYFFLVGAITKERAEAKYGVEIDQTTYQYPDFNQISGEKTNTATGNSSANTKDLLDEIICFYKDDDRDICKLVWVGNTPVQLIPKYYYPRVKECECGYENDQEARECEECGSKKLKTKIIMEETITEDMELEPIIYPRKKKELVVNEDGSKYVKQSVSQEVIERKVPKGTKVPIPAPKIFPLVIRRNIPMNFSFRGRSDVETIADQQEAIKKIWSKAEEKILQAGAVITKPTKVKQQFTDDAYQIWEGSGADLAQIYVKDLRTDTSQDLNFAEANYQKAKSILGITDSYQGKYDPSAKSGKAKEVQVEQAAGRLQSKIKNKFTFYSELFELMFYFDMCFTNEPRPYARTNSNGEEEYEEFDKYQLLCQDEAGEWYFNTDFSFKAEIASNLPSDKMFLFEQANIMKANGTLDNRQYLEILSSLNFPIANRLLEQVKDKEAEQNEIKEILTMFTTMDPNQLLQFLQLPLEQQVQMIEQTKNPEEGQTPNQPINNQKGGY